MTQCETRAAPAVRENLGQVQSLVRAFGILDVLAESPGGMTLTEVAREIDLPRSTTHRLLTTMDSLRYVEFERHGARWLVGMQALALSRAITQGNDLGRLARPILRRVMLETDETVSIATLAPNACSYLAQARPAGSPAHGGSQLPLNTTAAGKVLLAFASEDVRDAFMRGSDLVRRTRASMTEKLYFGHELGTVRDRGYGIDDEENCDGARCVAVPVFGADRSVIAALSVSGSAARLRDDRIAALAGNLAGAASDVARRVAALGTPLN